MLVGCTFFRVSTTYSITPEQLEVAKEDYIIVHMPMGEAYRLNHIIIDTEKNEITGIKEKIDLEHHLLKDVSNSNNRYKPKLNPRHDELHLYVKVNEEISQASAFTIRDI